MFDKLAATERQYDELIRLIGSVEVQNDQSEFRKHSKTLAETAWTAIATR